MRSKQPDLLAANVVNHHADLKSNNISCKIEDNPLRSGVKYHIANYNVIQSMLISLADDTGKTEEKASDFVPPVLPRGHSWPSDKYSTSPELGTANGIVKFLARVWQPLIIAGFAERRIVAQLDPSVIRGILSYERHRYGQSRKIPPHLRFLTVGEAKAFRARERVMRRLTPPSP